MPFFDNFTAVITEDPDSNIICSDGTCVDKTTGQPIPTTTPHNEIDNDIAEKVTPPKEGGQDFKNSLQNDSPVSSEQDSSKGLAVGLSLGFIFLTLLVLIIVFVVWRNRNAKDKAQDKEKQKPAAAKKTAK